jgi:uncharacterized protein (DUF1778 family)
LVVISLSANERLEIRVTSEGKSRLAAAADLVDQPVSEFVRSAIEDRVNEVLQTYRETRVPQSYFADLLAALNEPPEPNPALRKAAGRARRNVTSA